MSWANVMVVDNRFISQLSVREQGLIQDAIQNGLGMYIIADNSLTEKAYPMFLSPITNQIALKTGKLDRALFSWEQIKTKEPIQTLRSRFETKALIKDENGDGVVSVFEYGKGKLAVSMSQNTYSWRLAGDPQLHSQYWQNIIKTIGKPQVVPRLIWGHADLLDSSKTLKRACFDNLTPDTNVGYRTPSGEEKALLLTEDAVFENRYCGLVNQKEPGWYHVNVNNDNDSIGRETLMSVFLDGKSSWQTFNEFNSITATKKRMLTIANSNKVLDSATLSNFILYLILLPLLAALWAEQRFHNLLNG